MQQNKFQRIAVVLIIVVGMGLISYPLFSSIVNSFRQDDVVTTYDTVVSSLNSDDIEKAYEDSEQSGREYERVVNYVKSLLKEN